MIYTVTLNPAIDCNISAKNIIQGRVNRADSQNLRFSGKGVNVSYVLKEFGADSVLAGFVAGFTGDALTAGLTADGFNCDFVRLSNGTTRINVKLIGASTGDPDTEINAPGPTPTDDDLRALTDKLSGAKCGDAVVLAGSLPKGISADYIRTIASALSDGARLVCDLSGNALRTALGCSPHFVKPNVHELFELLDIPQTEENLRDRVLIAGSAEKLIAMGAENALVTLGGNGAYFVSANGDSEFIPTPACTVSDGARSAVGCGDSTVAGILIGMGYAGDPVRDHAFRCTGAKTAAELAVILGTASYLFGFPPSPEKVRKMK